MVAPLAILSISFIAKSWRRSKRVKKMNRLSIILRLLLAEPWPTLIKQLSCTRSDCILLMQTIMNLLLVGAAGLPITAMAVWVFACLHQCLPVFYTLIMQAALQSQSFDSWRIYESSYEVADNWTRLELDSYSYSSSVAKFEYIESQQDPNCSTACIPKFPSVLRYRLNIFDLLEGSMLTDLRAIACPFVVAVAWYRLSNDWWWLIRSETAGVLTKDIFQVSFWLYSLHAGHSLDSLSLPSKSICFWELLLHGLNTGKNAWINYPACKCELRHCHSSCHRWHIRPPAFSEHEGRHEANRDETTKLVDTV